MPRSRCADYCGPSRLTPHLGTERITTAIQCHAKEMLCVDGPIPGVAIYTDARQHAAAGIPVVLYAASPRSIGEANAA